MSGSTARLGLGVCTGAVTLVAAWGLRPLAAGWWFGSSLVIVSIVVMAGALMRASPLPLPLEPLGTAVGLGWALALVHAPATMRWLILPTADTLPALRQLVTSGRDDAWQAVAPAGYTPGLALLVAGAVGLVALVVDTLVAGLDLPGLALVPLATLYAAPWVIGVGFPPWWSFVLTVGGWLVLLAIHPGGDRSTSTEPRPRPSGLIRALITSTAALGGALLIAGQVAPAEVSLVEQGGSGAGLRVDPRVSLRRTLVGQRDTVALRFTTTAGLPDYLRLAVLTQFDGREWVPGPASEGPTPLLDDGSSQTYELNIVALEGPAVPSPAGTSAVRTAVLTNWDPWLGVPVRSDGGSVRGSAAQVIVTAPNPSRAQLAAPNNAPAQFSADPSDLIGPRLGALARQVAGKGDSDLERARKLQEWFTSSGGFRYSLDVPPGSDRSDLDRFVDERTGYCEQFASTMALMARTLGIPARVVVGFVPGVFQDGSWVVTGADAHAWPELWLGSAGWLRFEPTPRDSVDLPDYSSADGPVAPDAQDAVEPAPEASRSPARDVAPEAAGPELAPQPTTGGLHLPAWSLWVFALFAATLLAPSSARSWRRRRRLARAEVPAACAYDEVVDTLVDLRLGEAAATPRMTGELVAVTLAAGPANPAASATAAATRIVAGVEAAWYARPAADACALSADVAAVTKELRKSVNWKRRLVGWLWPASLWRR